MSLERKGDRELRCRHLLESSNMVLLCLGYMRAGIELEGQILRGGKTNTRTGRAR